MVGGESKGERGRKRSEGLREGEGELILSNSHALIQRRTQEMREKRSKERERRGTERVEARVGRKS